MSSEGNGEVNINETTRNRITKNLNNPTRFNLREIQVKLKKFKFSSSFSKRDIFLEAEKHIYELMKKNSYQRFEQSEQYKALLEKAIIPSSKKK